MLTSCVNAFWESDATVRTMTECPLYKNKEGTRREKKKSNRRRSMMTKRTGRGGDGWTVQSCSALNGVNEGLRAHRHKSPRRTGKGDNCRKRDTFDRSFFFFFTPRGDGNSLCKLRNRNTILRLANIPWRRSSSPRNTTPSELALATDVLIAWRINQASYV